MRCFYPLLIALLIPVACRAQDLNYPDFSSVAGLQINGNAAQVGNVLRVSNAAAFREGSVFSSNRIVLRNENSFSTFFEFRIGASGGIGDGDGPGADGLVFAIQPNANNVGGTGGGIGYSGIGSSIGIEFDTYNNGSTSGDLNGNHVGVDLNGNISSVIMASESQRFNNSQIWRAWIDYNGLLDELEVRWTMDTQKPIDSMLSMNLDLQSIIGQDSAFVGFTSATGNGYGNHDLLQWQFYGEIAVPEPGIGGPLFFILAGFFLQRRARVA